MTTKLQDSNPPQNAEQVDNSLYSAVKSEVQHELAHIEDSKEPVDSTQSDVLVQKHFSGLFITLLVLVAVFLLGAIAVIAMYKRH